MPEERGERERESNNNILLRRLSQTTSSLVRKNKEASRCCMVLLFLDLCLKSKNKYRERERVCLCERERASTLDHLYAACLFCLYTSTLSSSRAVVAVEVVVVAVHKIVSYLISYHVYRVFRYA